MSIVESQKSYEPRVVFFYFLFAAMVAVLAGGLGYRQLALSGDYSERERIQNQRRILVPGPRGNVYDRHGQLLVANRPRFSAVLHLAELRDELRRETIRVVRNYRELDRADRPRPHELESIARVAVAQRYLDEVNRILGREERVDPRRLDRHYRQQLLLPFPLVEELSPAEFARLVEQLPVGSPVEVYSSSARSYPHGHLAAHALGYVGAFDEIEAEDFAGEDLRTFRMRGTMGRTGLERRFDELLQGEAGGTIFRVDPAGFKINPPLETRRPVQGRHLVSSLDLELQRVADAAMGRHKGAAVAMQITTGEVLVMVSKPDYDLNLFAPSLSAAAAKDIEERGAWLNRAAQGLYPPGSTFKLVTALAGLRSGAVDPSTRSVCTGYHQVGGRRFPCHNRHGHGEVDLRGALRVSCNVWFYEHGLETGAQLIAAEARRFRLHEPTGIELPAEARAMIVPDPAWKRERVGVPWFPGDTANYSIGQGFLRVTPLQVAAAVASLARAETVTVPTLVHQPGRNPSGELPREALAIAMADWQAIVEGMEQAVQLGTARLARVPGLRVAGKTGTAQVQDRGVNLELAWIVAFAPIESPEIAVAVMLEGTEPDENFAGGRMAAPVAQAILQAWFDRQEANRSPPAVAGR
jgi:penicillin-binding protein 2